MPSDKHVRCSNIEILRILAIFGVIMLHYFNAEIGGGIKHVESGSLNYYILHVFESAFVGTVDLFFMISGFFLIKSNVRKIRKPVELIIQVILFREFAYVLNTVITHKSLSVKAVIGNLLPNNYFVVFYCILFILSPYINKLLDSITQKQAKRLVVILVVIFSLNCTVVQIISNINGKQINGLDSVGLYGSQGGYTIVNFTFMYLLGALIGKYKLMESYNSKIKLTLTYILSVVVLTVWALIESNCPDKVGSSAYMYCNPFVILGAVAVFLLFLNIDMGSNKVINKIASGVFSVFLLHSYLLKHIRIEQFVKGNALIMVVHMLVSGICIILVCTLCHFIYTAITRPIYNLIFRKFDFPIVNLEGKNDIKIA